MKKPRLLLLLKKGWNILAGRLKTQGIKVTLVWLYGRGLPALTGVPLLKFSQVTPQIFVGPQYRRNGKHHLEKNGIEYCVNMRIERDDSRYGLALTHYLHLPTIDDDAPSLSHLDQGVAFIQKAIPTGGKVYIHCGAGVGRAPSMAAAYLMAEGHSLEESLELIENVRPFISITPKQMEQLRLYEKHLLFD